MARKSKVQILTEQLAEISDCPKDIFLSSYDADSLFAVVKAAERKDKVGIIKLLTMLYEDDLTGKCREAFIYFAKRGLSEGLSEAAVLLARYSLRINSCFDEALAAVCYLGESSNGVFDAALSQIRDRVISNWIIENAAKKPEDTLKMLQELHEDYISERIYAYSKLRKYEEIEKIVGKELLPMLSLPTVMAKEAKTCKDTDGFFGQLVEFYSRYTLPQWHEFFIRCLYEYTEIYVDSDFSNIASSAVDFLLTRTSCSCHRAHALCWLAYILNKTDKSHEDYPALEAQYNSLLLDCKFDGTPITDISVNSALEEEMRKSLYTDYELCKRQNEEEIVFGSKIIHASNRYNLCATLEGHAKRGRYHFWELVASFPTSDSKQPPKFDKIKIDEVRHKLTRNGITKNSDPKKYSQLICSSEISLLDSRHPFTLDLILDIAYVCSSKCVSGEIKVKEVDIVGDYYVMKCGIYLE